MMNFGDINWKRWIPREKATLMLIVRRGRILLILKKRGLGAGLYNGPGGRLEPGETPLQAAMREVREEIGVTPSGVKPADGHSIRGFVFRASGFRGMPRETDEAIPEWFSVKAIPYHNMWADDRIWLPLLLAGKKFSGRFLFDGDQMLGCEISV